MTGRRVLYLLGLLCSVIFHLVYREWFSWIVLLALFFLPVFSLAISLRAMFCTKIQVKTASRITAGSIANGLIEVNCPVPVPPHTCKLRVTKSGTGESLILRVGDRLPTDHCGGLVVELHRPRVYDYLGLFKKRVRRTEPKKVCVMPIPEELQVPPDLSRAIARSWRPKYGGGYAENHEIRPYHPGDMMNLIHWKLSAKADTLMVREPMVPDGNKMIISLVLKGSSDQIDRKMGQLLWLGTWLLSQGASYEVRALTGNGTERWSVGSERELECCLEALLYAPYSHEGDLWDVDNTAAWHYRIGGELDEE